MVFVASVQVLVKLSIYATLQLTRFVLSGVYRKATWVETARYLAIMRARLPAAPVVSVQNQQS